MASEYLRLGRIVDLFTSFFSSDTTIADQTSNGLDATLLSGRYPTLDASADTITYATDYASALRTATVMMRVTSTGNRTITSGSGTFTFTPTATGVWELLTAPAVTVAGDLSWTAGPDCDISDLRIYEDGVEGDRWIHAELESGDPDGLPVANSIRPLITGTYDGGSFSSGEPTILQTAGMDWNKYSWFNGEDSEVDTGLNVSDLSPTLLYAEATVVVFDLLGIKSFISQNSANESCFEIRTIYGKPSFGMGDSGGTFSSVTSPDDIPLNVEVVIRGEWDGATKKIFVDGVEKASSAQTSINASAITTTFVGSRPDSSQFTEGLVYGASVEDDTGVLFAYTGLGNDPWKDTIGSNNGTESGTFKRLLTPVSDTDPTLDAYGNALTFQRTPKTLNLPDGASAQIAAPVPDTIKTVANWIWHDGTAKTHIDGGNWTVGSTGTALTSTGFTGAAYFVNGVSGTTLSAGWNHVMVASPAALTTPYIHYTEVQAHFLAYITTEGADTALQNYTTTKSDYGL